jgi:hypothetical protein
MVPQTRQIGVAPVRTLPGMTEPTGNYYAPGYGPLPGQPGYGEPIPAPAAFPAYGGPQYPPIRPSSGTVLTAAIIQIAQGSLYVLGALGVLLLAGVANDAGDEIDRRSDSDISGITDTIARLLAVVGVVVLALAVFMIVLAALAIRGRRWAAITSVVLQALTAAAGLVGLSLGGTGDTPGFGLVFVLISIAVAVLFLLPSSTAYFTARKADPHP